MISVVIPLFNKEKSISNTINSVLRQDFSDFEIVVVDDGSTDGSVAIVEAMNDPRIRLIKQENGGPSKARNTGVKCAKGDWIVMLDADDELLPNALNTFLITILNHPEVDIIDANKYTLIGKTKQIAFHPIEGYVKNPFKEWFLGRISPGNGASAFKRSFLVKHLFDEHIRRFEDAALLMKQFPFAKVYSLKVPTLLFNRNFAEASRPRKNVKEDYFAYLDFKKGGFWQKMCMYRIFLGEREYYPEYSKEKYGKMYRRYDWLLIYKLLNWYSKFFKR